MKKSLIFLTLMILLVGTFVSGSLGVFKQCSNVDIKTILNSTWVNITTIIYPNSTNVLEDVEMTARGMSFNYTFNDTCTLGNYIYEYIDDSGNYYVNDFLITPSGVNPTIAQSGLSIGILASIVVLMFFFGWLSFKFMETDKGFPIGLFFLIISIIISVYGLYLGVVFSRDYLYSSVADVQSKIFIGIMFGLIGIIFLALLGLIIMTLKEIKERKSVQKYGEGWNSKTKQYDYSKR